MSGRSPPRRARLAPGALRVAMQVAVQVAVLSTVVSCSLDRRVVIDSRVGITLPGVIEACGAAKADRDADGIDDTCELALARAFAPVLVVDPSDCSWIGTRLGGGYLFAVQRGPDANTFRIAYLPAYFRDCGWAGLPCLTRGRSCAAHAGDSELIAVEARYDNATRMWRTAALFLSAHCFGRSAGRCRWYAGNQLAHFTWADGARLGAARVWVAKGKHANYSSRLECDSGHWYYDSCDDNRVGYRFPVVSSSQNIGSPKWPLPEGGARPGCIGAAALAVRSPVVDAGTIECFWDARSRFRGWQIGTGDGATAYARVLAAAGF